MDVIELNDKFALGFAVWIANNSYENFWNREASWVSIEEVLEVGEDNAKCYTIEELLKKYKDGNT